MSLIYMTLDPCDDNHSFKVHAKNHMDALVG